MWDCMDGLFDRRQIVVRGFWTMPREVQDDSRPLLEILEELHRENPEITYRIEEGQ